jgi:hypothetical protein
MTKLEKAMHELEEYLCGSCNSFDIGEFAEDFDVDELELAQAMDHAEIFLCNACGWWQFPGDYCGIHDHDEISCNDCCEEEDED